jgi:hypothetical protein
MTALVAIIALGFAPLASAKVMTATFRGHVIYGEDNAGFFGAPGGIYEGDSYVATFIYDTERANHVSSPTSDLAVGGTNNGVVLNPLSPLLSASLAIGGHVHALDPSGFGSASTQQHDSVSFFAFQTEYTPLSNDDPETYIIHYANFDASNDLTTPVSVSLSGFASEGSARWRRLDHGVLVTDADIYLRADQLTIRPGIPEPASWAIMILGFAAAGGALRGRRTVPVSR